jgi:hypothetical protein
MGTGIVFMGMAFELVALSLGGYYLGEYIDQRMGWQSTASSAMVVTLMVGWFLHLIILLRRFEKENSDSEPKS